MVRLKNELYKITIIFITSLIALHGCILPNTISFAVDMNISEAGIEFIKSVEGCRLSAYKALSTEEYYTIGYGHYGADVSANMVISQDEAEVMLRNDLVKYVGFVNTFLNKNSIVLNQHQFDALVSFTYNLGNVWVSEPTFKLKTYLINGVNNYSSDEITTAFTNWNKSGGAVIEGLTNRRRKEAAYFLTGSGTSNNISINTTVDSSYATPWNGEPTATSGLITVYNEYGTAYPQNQRNIAHNDQCTVHEVYTSGFCKVTYPTASGSRTEYAKASDFNIPQKATDTVKPQVSKISYSHVSTDMFRVEIDASDNVKMNKVDVAVWGETDGQDDLIWYSAVQYTDTHWYCDVYTKDHKNYYGNYIVHIYAYDDAGNDGFGGSAVEVGMYPLTVDPNGGTVKDENGKVVTSAFKTSKNKLIYNGTNYYSLTWTSPSKTGYSFTGYYTAKTGGTQIYGTDGKCLNEGTYFKDNHYQKASSLIVYAQWKAIPYKRTLVLDGGTCNKTYVTVTYGQKIGTLPTPKKNGYTFEGWYTGKTDGEKVTADTVITVAGDASLYARWKAIPVTTTTKKVTTTTTKVTTTTTKKVTTTTTKPVITTTKNITTTTTSKPITTVTTTTKPIITPTTTTVPELEPTVKGDANGDNTVDVADVVIVKCYLINSSNYSISKQGVVNVDVHESGNGINIQDVLAIQKKVLKIIDDFDLI